MTGARLAVGGVTLLAGIALLVYGVIVATARPSEDLDRAGQVIFGALPGGVGLVLIAIGGLVLRRGGAAAVWSAVAVALIIVGVFTFAAAGLLGLLVILLALVIVCVAFAHGHSPEHLGRAS